MKIKRYARANAVFIISQIYRKLCERVYIMCNTYIRETSKQLHQFRSREEVTRFYARTT